MSLVGRVETIRMNVLPRLFLLNSLPITVPVCTFPLLDKLVFQIHMAEQKTKRLKVLCAIKEMGGLALSHFRSYYWKLVSWMRLDMHTK